MVRMEAMNWAFNKRTCSRGPYPILKVNGSKLLMNRGSPTSWFTCSNDTEIFYDAADTFDMEGEPPIAVTSNQCGASENDRYGDHSDLSKQQNIEVCAGQRQPPTVSIQQQQQQLQQQEQQNENCGDTNTDMCKRQSDQYFIASDIGFCSSGQSVEISSETCRRLFTAQPNEPNSTVRISSSTQMFTAEGSFHCQCEETGSRCADCRSEYKQGEGSGSKPDCLIKKILSDTFPSSTESYITATENPQHRQKLRRKIFKPCFISYNGQEKMIPCSPRTPKGKENTCQQQRRQVTPRTLEYWIRNSCRMHSMNRSFRPPREINNTVRNHDVETPSPSSCGGSDESECQTQRSLRSSQANPDVLKNQGDVTSITNQCPWSMEALKTCCKWIQEETDIPNQIDGTNPGVGTETGSPRKPPLEEKELIPKPGVKPEQCLQWTAQNPSMGPPFALPTLSYCSIGTAITPRPSSSEKMVSLMEKMCEMLQNMKDESLIPPPPIAQDLENSQDLTFEDALVEVPQMPPIMSIAPTTCMQCIKVATTPPFNIFITPLASQEECTGAYIGVNPEQPPPVTATSSQLSATNFFDSFPYVDDLPGIDLLEPPERDLDPLLEDQPSSQRKKKLIPVDMDLMRTADDFDWKDSEIGIPKECQVNMDNLDEIARNFVSIFQAEVENEKCALSKEVQVNQDDLIGSSTTIIERTASDLSKTIQVDLRSYEEFIPKTAQFLHYPVYPDPSLRQNLEISMQDVATSEEFLESPMLSSMPSERQETSSYYTLESMSAIQNYSPLATGNSSKRDQTKPKEVAFKNITSDTANNTYSPRSHCETVIPDLENTDTITHRDGLDSQATTSNIGTDRTHLGSQLMDAPQTPVVDQFIDSIISDLKAMKEERERLNKINPFPMTPSGTIDVNEQQQALSFPVTIEKVQELGTSSLFVKWRVQDITNITGYEVLLDGHITNRYFSHVHRAVVICQVNLRCPHRIIVRAKSKSAAHERVNIFESRVASSTPDHPGACSPQPDGTVWYPSVYHFEPNFSPVPMNLLKYSRAGKY